MKEENVLKQPKKPLQNNTNISLLIKFKATKIPKKKDDKKFTIEILWISKPILFLKLFCINILSINPKVLPIKIIVIELKSKIYIFIQPFKILLGSSKYLLEANSTLTQVSLSLTFQFRNIDKVVPTSRTNNSFA